jgi:hypothetical protein
MNAVEAFRLSSRAYSTLLQEVSLWGKLFQSKSLNFTMQAQTQSNWCWAATATSVSHFYWWFSPWVQCTVANAELARTDACHAPVPAACNVPWYLDRALTRTNNFVSITGPVTFQQIRDEIDAGRPVGARIGWSGGGGHFMVIYGYSIIAGTTYFDIDDPIYHKSHLTVSDFSTNYQGSGSWTHTYFTKSYFKLPIRFFYPNELILKRIWEARPLLNLKRGDLSIEPRELTSDAGASLGLAHRVFTLGLDALRSERAALEARPAGVRVYETTKDAPQAFFDVTDDDEPRVVQMSSAKPQLEVFARAMDQALALAERSKEEVEVRLLRVPALNFEGLWLTGDTGTDRGDQIVPLRNVGRLYVNQPVPLNEAMDALRDAARPLAQMDDTMGA